MVSILWVQHTAYARLEQLGHRPKYITTFRKGEKWLRPELIGTQVKLVNCGKAHSGPCGAGCELFGYATISKISYQSFSEITVEDHVRQSSDMTPAERLNIMRSVYGEYDSDTLTTVITLRNPLLLDPAVPVEAL
jgi:hypothetical protein